VQAEVLFRLDNAGACVNWCEGHSTVAGASRNVDGASVRIVGSEWGLGVDGASVRIMGSEWELGDAMDRLGHGDRSFDHVGDLGSLS
jgi:hypothetical protein